MANTSVPTEGTGTMKAVRFHGKEDLRFESIPEPKIRAGFVKVKPGEHFNDHNLQSSRECKAKIVR